MPGAYDPVARIKALDEMKIDMQAISPSPILLFYWEDAAVAAHFSRRQNEAIQDVVKKHPDRFIGFGSVPLQSVAESIAIAREAKSMGLKGLEIGNAVGEKPLDDPSFEPFFQAAQELELLLFVHPLEGGLDADDPLSPVLGNVLQFTFRTTMMVERMILKGMFEKYPNLRLCLSHGGGLLAFNIWRLDHSYGLRADLQKAVAAETFRVFETDVLRHHRPFGGGAELSRARGRRRPGGDRHGLSDGDGRFRLGQ